ncbi:MAG: carbohydrate binding family 9 domain-containing protein [Acidobacteriia bacterium]|nr:carbohydrate binding family 9 domain-containing protein [Terriglobia bacterium]
MRAQVRACLTCSLLISLASSSAAGQTALSGESIRISKATGPITIDGDLSDEAWQHATRVETWYETNVTDNTPPKVRNVGHLTFDDKYFYAGLEFDDPDPSLIRAPFADRDNTPFWTDYGGVILDTRNSGHTAQLLVVNPHNIQYDSISDDASGEDSSPDFFWESATKITARGWTLEMKIPFSSLRYNNVDPQTWGILLYRNYPRDFHYQFFSAKLPRGGNCFICRANTLVGLERLPAGGHLVAAPYVNASQTAQPAGDALGAPLVNGDVNSKIGIDVKYTPNADNAIDFTVKPDFSQVESDTAQISANERFALFFPEKRPFFLEGVELFSTPIQAVYTRTITAPRWGGRVTGKDGGVTFTALVSDDGGGGSAILPGANGSSLASVDFGSNVFIARAKRDIGRSFISVLVTDREAHNDQGAGAGDNGHNRVVGPDFQWRPSATDTVTGQLLFSHTHTPNRPDLADEWTGQQMTSHAGLLWWSHNTTHFDSYAQYKDIGDGFRADSGFVPQVGLRETFASSGWTFRPTGAVSRLRTFINVDRQVDLAGALISREVLPGFGMDTRYNGFMQVRYIDDEIRSGDRTFPRHQFGYIAQFSPSRVVAQVSLDGTAGTDIDFANSRPARGTTINLSARINPTQHVDLSLVQNQRWLDVDDAAGASQRLFIARVSRVKGTYTFTSRLFVRGIAQYTYTSRDPLLYTSSASARSGDFGGSLLLAYKLNWQSVMFVGYGDDRELSDQQRLEKLDRQVFVKLSYAFQR